MSSMNGKQVLRKLVASNQRYAAGRARNPNQTPEVRQQLAEGQQPIAAIITCADSRVSPAILFDRGLGELFVIRVAGNIASDEILGSVEYAVENLGVSLIVVLGHSSCGAVTAAVQGGEAPGHLAHLVQAIQPAVDRARGRDGDPVENATRENIAMVVEQIRASEPILKKRAVAGELEVVGAYYHLDTGLVEFPEMDAGLEKYLVQTGEGYSEEQRMLGAEWKGPGYHTRVPDGTWAHSTRSTLDYALALLQAGGEKREKRATDIVDRVLGLQETDPTDDYFGVWPWLLEEPVREMAPPDRNWADFCGAILAQMLIEHAGQLPESLRIRMREGLGHAAWEIFRRNVGPEYTNIAVMGAAVTLMAGEILDEKRLVDYGRGRLSRFVRYARRHGGFNEYNSPTYTMVALHECERILQLVEDEEARRTANRLRGWIWHVIGLHFHPRTGQWAGPHSRAYRDRLGERELEELLVGAGVKEDDGQTYSSLQHLPCPEWSKEQFAELKLEEVERRNCFVRAEVWQDSRWGTTWMSQDACLSSINHEDMWTQRRPLIGYWEIEGAESAVLRLRFLRDGRDFASVCVHQNQQRNRVLSAFGLAGDRGDFHVHLDRPTDGIFQVEDLRVRYELSGENARGEALGDGRFALMAGEHTAVVHTMPSRFGEFDVVWEVGEEDGKVFVDGICYRGELLDFDLESWGEVVLAAGLELLRVGEKLSEVSVQAKKVREGYLEVSWDRVSKLTMPLSAHPAQSRGADFKQG
jgi:carbonic anhydrase